MTDDLDSGPAIKDPWPTLASLTALINQLAGEVNDLTQQLNQTNPSAPPADGLEEWVEWLKNEYGLHAAIGNTDRWSTPPVRNELAALRIASGALSQTGIVRSGLLA